MKLVALLNKLNVCTRIPTAEGTLFLDVSSDTVYIIYIIAHGEFVIVGKG
jgi:hypothetical protein